MPEWTRAPDDVSGNLMDPPSWDYEALGDEAKVDLDAEKENAERKNQNGLEKNKKIQTGV